MPNIKQAKSGDIKRYVLHDIKFDMAYSLRKVFKLAHKRTNKSTYQAMESFVHNMNTLNSRAGSQVPFSSVNYGTCTTPEGRMLISNLLYALDAGLGHGETAIFPIHIFKVMDGINGNPGDINYDLFQLACRVSGRRLFPNFTFLDAPFNKQYYVPGHPETESATMGCVDPKEVITYKIGKFICVESIERAFNKFADFNIVKTSGESEYIDLSKIPAKIYDSHSKEFVKLKKIIKNPNKNNWKLLVFSNGRSIVLTEDHPLPIKGKGRTKVKDLEIGDKIRISNYYNNVSGDYEVNYNWAYLLGILLCDSSYQDSIVISLGLDEMDIVKKIMKCCKTLGYTTHLKEQNRGKQGNYYDLSIRSSNLKELRLTLTRMFGGIKKEDRHIPNEVFNWNEECKLHFLAGMMDADGYIRCGKNNNIIMNLGSTNKELALQQLGLIQSLNAKCRVYRNHYKGCGSKNVRYMLDFKLSKLNQYMSCIKKISQIENTHESFQDDFKYATLVEIKNYINYENSYDVETESDKFDISGICSHNCRTRVVGNVNKDYEVFTGRGNLSFTSINLPRLGILANHNIDQFFESLDKLLDLVFIQLIDRFEVQAKRKCKNMPFLMGQHIYIGSEKLGPEDEVREVIKHGTLTVGFIGLAETLVALIGKHHGESAEAQELGLKIVKHLRDRCDEQTQKTQLNFSLIGTPAEGLSGRFVDIDKKKFGVIPGITDKAYYTNSNHVPVYYDISITDKIDIEAPYHAYENGGHISYVEVTGDVAENPEAFEQIIQYMKHAGIGYGSINHPVDRDPLCGYVGVIGDSCPRCGRKDGEGITKAQLALAISCNKEYRVNDEIAEEFDKVNNKFNI